MDGEVRQAGHVNKVDEFSPHLDCFVGADDAPGLARGGLALVTNEENMLANGVAGA